MDVVLSLGLSLAVVAGVQARSGGSLASKTAGFLAVALELRDHNLSVSDD